MALEKLIQPLTTVLGNRSDPILQIITKDPFIDVRAYGAIGNGIADDTTAIQNAITAAMVNGGIVFFPPLTYLTSGEITIVNANKVTLLGYGAKINSTSTSNIIRVGRDSYSASDHAEFNTIQGLHLYSITCKTGLMLDGRYTNNNIFKDLYIETSGRIKGDNSQGICILDKALLPAGSGSYNNIFGNIWIQGFDKNISNGYDWANGTDPDDAPNGQIFSNISNEHFLTYGVYFKKSSYNRYSGNFFGGNSSSSADIFLEGTSLHNFFDTQNESSGPIGYDIQLGSISNYFKIWMAAGYNLGADGFIDRNNTTESTTKRQSEFNTVQWVNNPNNDLRAMLALNCIRLKRIEVINGQDFYIRLALNKSFYFTDQNQNNLLILGDRGSTPGQVTAVVPLQLRNYNVNALPSAANDTGALIYVANESGGATVAFSDGTNWRRVQDRSIVS